MKIQSLPRSFFPWLLTGFLLISSSWSRADVVIHEIHYNPLDESTLGEFVELHNSGDQAIHVADPAGAMTYGGQTYRLALPEDSLSWRVVTVGASRVIEVQSGASTGYAAWRDQEFTQAESEDPAVSGPLATPAGQDLTNLMRYALGLTRDESPTTKMPRLESPVSYRFPIDPAKTDIIYRVRTSTDMEDWSGVLYDSSLPGQIAPVEGWVTLPVPAASGGKRFLKLEVTAIP